ncbi:SDR family NAD(P)-dependent oxidoreductase [Patulibacter americanus]|uniref:SDR family NAD(P)-dependent oxidoreductase n=1 Tax=Patulibacter americanus TaxID=588672 RepID=UPI0003B3C730|nr:SDR family NAD(P)-dependent oxidoreductase [Patulibacter americanus]
MTTTLITGANKSLGRETARRLIAEGHDVWIGARNAERGQEAADALGGRFVQLDVTDDASVAAAVETITAAGTGLDVLVNNAGVPGPFADPLALTVADYEGVYAANVFGVVRVTQAFLPLLRASQAPVIVNVSSGMGSIAATTDPSRVESGAVMPIYTSSKAALNMVTTQWATALPEIRVNAVDPGYTATDFNGHQGHQTVEEGAAPIVRMALVGTDGPTGTFESVEGPAGW